MYVCNVCMHNTYIHVIYMYMYSGTGQVRKTLCWLFLDQYFLKKKSETSSEDNSARVVCLDDLLSAPRSRTWRTCFYILLFISQPEPNIRAWGKKIIKLEVHAEVRLGMNLFLFCLHLAVPSTFRPKLPPERGQRSGFKDVWGAFAWKVSHHGLGPWHSLLAAGALRCLVRSSAKPNDREGCSKDDCHLPTNSWHHQDSIVV